MYNTIVIIIMCARGTHGGIIFKTSLVKTVVQLLDKQKMK